MGSSEVKVTLNLAEEYFLHFIVKSQKSNISLLSRSLRHCITFNEPKRVLNEGLKSSLKNFVVKTNLAKIFG